MCDAPVGALEPRGAGGAQGAKSAWDFLFLCVLLGSVFFGSDLVFNCFCLVLALFFVFFGFWPCIVGFWLCLLFFGFQGWELWMGAGSSSAATPRNEIGPLNVTEG